MSSQLFRGIESEGMFRGLATLFVEGHVSTLQIVEQVTCDRFHQVYFGAMHGGTFGLPSQVDIASVEQLLCSPYAGLVTVETIQSVQVAMLHEMMHMKQNLRLMVPVLDDRVMGSALTRILRCEFGNCAYNVQVKLGTAREHLLVAPLASFIYTDMTVNLQDRVIKLK